MANGNSAEKAFELDGVKYRIDTSRKVKTAGDFDERTSTVMIDKDFPEKFHEGVALHEIVERRFIKKGHSYQYSHNEAQKAELEFYRKKFGADAENMMREEEEFVLKMPCSKRPKRQKKEPPVAIPKVQTVFIRAIIYGGKQYVIDNSNTLVGDIVDFYEKKRIIYIDREVPEKYFEGLAVYVIEERKMLMQGCSYADANAGASKKELAYWEEKLGSREAAEKAVTDELAIQSAKFTAFAKDLKEGEHKVIYDNVPK